MQQDLVKKAQHEEWLVVETAANMAVWASTGGNLAHAKVADDLHMHMTQCNNGGLYLAHAVYIVLFEMESLSCAKAAYIDVYVPHATHASAIVVATTVKAASKARQSDFQPIEICHQAEHRSASYAC